MVSKMVVLGIDPAPAKASVVFDGKRFYSLMPQELNNFIKNHNETLFIAWDAPLSAALDQHNFSLTIRPIERFFNRLGGHAKKLGIPEGITTLGFAGCPHWTLSQYIFGLPRINTQLHLQGDFELLMEHDTQIVGKKYITEIHPALSMWIFFRESLSKEPLFQTSWRYKGDAKSETRKRRAYLSDAMIQLAQRMFLIDEITINNDDELDAFVCWFLGKLYVEKNKLAMIYGDSKVGSFLLPYDKEVLQSWQNYLLKSL